jgi:choline kinase
VALRSHEDPERFVIDRVVVLGAGLGQRLRPLTDDRPKCVVELAGEPLAVRMLRQFAARGCRHGVVVVGHQADRARAIIGPRVDTMDVSFVENADYAVTNTMYSALLAAASLEGGAYLVEGDIACGDEVVARLIAADPSLSHWAADPWTPRHTGSRLLVDRSGRIIRQEIWRGVTTGDTTDMWKSAGMLKLSPDGASTLIDALRDEAAAGHRAIYYDDVVGRHVDRFDLRILDLTGAPWVEIDDLADLAEARRLFEGTAP